MNQIYVDTVRLLLAIASSVFESKNFALKGGTALNLFVQDMPRLSVDIDVVFTDWNLDRNAALAAIAVALAQVQAALQARGYRATPLRSRLGDEVKLMVTSDLASVKVEVNFVFRGTVLPVVQMPLALAARSLFATGVTLPVLDTLSYCAGRRGRNCCCYCNNIVDKCLLIATYLRHEPPFPFNT